MVCKISRVCLVVAVVLAAASAVAQTHSYPGGGDVLTDEGTHFSSQKPIIIDDLGPGNNWGGFRNGESQDDYGALTTGWSGYFANVRDQFVYMDTDNLGSGNYTIAEGYSIHPRCWHAWNSGGNPPVNDQVLRPYGARPPALGNLNDTFTWTTFSSASSEMYNSHSLPYDANGDWFIIGISFSGGEDWGSEVEDNNDSVDLTVVGLDYTAAEVPTAGTVLGALEINDSSGAAEIDGLGASDHLSATKWFNARVPVVGDHIAMVFRNVSLTNFTRYKVMQACALLVREGPAGALVRNTP